MLAAPGRGAPTVVDLGPGRWAAPAAAGAAVAVVDLDTGLLRTFDPIGAPRGTAPSAAGAAGPVRGEDGRLYLDDPQGVATTVVAPDGSITTVPTGGDGPGTVARAAAALPEAPTGQVQRDDRSVAIPRAADRCGGQAPG